VAILFVFPLGMGNFALHRAVLESRHPALLELGWLIDRFGGRASLALEFALLLLALGLVTSVDPNWGWAYLGYTALNAIGAWLMLSRRL